MIERGNIIADHQDVYRFLSGDKLEKLTLRDNVRSLLTTYSSFEPFAVSAYLYAANGGHLFASPYRMEQSTSAAFLVSQMI